MLSLRVYTSPLGPLAVVARNRKTVTGLFWPLPTDHVFNGVSAGVCGSNTLHRPDRGGKLLQYICITFRYSGA